MKITKLLGIFFLISFSIYGQGTFTFTTSTDNGADVTETVSTVLLTVSCSSSSVDNFDYGGWGGTSGRVAYNNVDAISMTLTFDKPVTISSLRAADGSGGVTEDWVYTPTPNNGTVTATTPANGGVTVNFNSNFVNITAITITRSGGGSTFFIIDDIVMDSYLPVELISFTALAENKSTVELEWETATEVNNYGFEIQRSVGNDQNSVFKKIGFVEGSGNSNSTKTYFFSDKTTENGKHSYRLKQIDFNGNYKYSDIVEININSELPSKFELSQNYPNPFNPATVIRYSIPVAALSGVEAQHVTLIVYDILGNEVATLVNENQSAGNYEVKFNASGLASGMYIYRIQAGEFVSSKKLMLMK